MFIVIIQNVLTYLTFCLLVILKINELKYCPVCIYN